MQSHHSVSFSLDDDDRLASPNNLHQRPSSWRYTYQPKLSTTTEDYYYAALPTELAPTNWLEASRSSARHDHRPSLWDNHSSSSIGGVDDVWEWPSVDTTQNPSFPLLPITNETDGGGWGSNFLESLFSSTPTSMLTTSASFADQEPEEVEWETPFPMWFTIFVAVCIGLCIIITVLGKRRGGVFEVFDWNFRFPLKNRKPPCSHRFPRGTQH